MKIAMGIRLSEEAKRLLRLLAQKLGQSQAGIIELAIRRLAEAEGIKVK